MGNQACCLKPDEKLTEVKGDKVVIDDIEQINSLEGYPHDSEQNKGQEQVSNQKLYNEEAQSPKEGNTYEVPINSKSPNENEQGENEEGGEEQGEEAQEEGDQEEMGREGEGEQMPQYDPRNNLYLPADNNYDQTGDYNQTGAVDLTSNQYLQGNVNNDNNYNLQEVNQMITSPESGNAEYNQFFQQSTTTTTTTTGNVDYNNLISNQEGTGDINQYYQGGAEMTSDTNFDLNNLNSGNNNVDMGLYNISASEAQYQEYGGASSATNFESSNIPFSTTDNNLNFNSAITFGQQSQAVSSSQYAEYPNTNY